MKKFNRVLPDSFEDWLKEKTFEKRNIARLEEPVEARTVEEFESIRREFYKQRNRGNHLKGNNYFLREYKESIKPHLRRYGQ